MNDAVPAAVIGVGTDLVEVGAHPRRARSGPRASATGCSPRPSTRTPPATVIPRRTSPAGSRSKEAVMKALGQGLGAVSFTDIEVINRPTR